MTRLPPRLLAFWTANDDVRRYLTGVMPGEEASPRQEGTNTLRDLTSCAIIYSAKKTPADEPSIDQFGLTSEDIETSREAEDISQFVMRGAMRERDFAGDFPIYLYDLHQAERLAAYLEANAIASVELVPVDGAGIMDVVRPKRDRGQKEELDERSRAENDEQRREADRERKARGRAAKREEKEKNGTYLTRGRPKMAKPVPPQINERGSELAPPLS